MVKRGTEDIAAIIEDEVAAIEDDRDAPIPGSSRVRRGNGRSETLQVRLNPEELAELERLAASRGLPTSTVAREAIIRLIRPDIARTAAANRLIEEFARYIDTLGSQAQSVAPAETSSTRNYATWAGGRLGLQGLPTADTDVEAISPLLDLDEDDLNYELYTDPQGKFRYRITGLSQELNSLFSGMRYRSEAAARGYAELDLAHLREEIAQMRSNPRK